MCKQDTVLKTIKKMAKNGELTDCAVMLAEAQAEDYKIMDTRIDTIESKVTEIDNKVDNVLLILNRQQSAIAIVRAFIKNPITLGFLLLWLTRFFSSDAIALIMPFIEKGL